MIEVKHQSCHWWGHLWWNCDVRGLSLCMIQLKAFKRCTCTYSDTHFVGSCCVVNCFLSLLWNTSKCQCILVLWNPLLYWIVSCKTKIIRISLLTLVYHGFMFMSWGEKTFECFEFKPVLLYTKAINKVYKVFQTLNLWLP